MLLGVKCVSKHLDFQIFVFMQVNKFWQWSNILQMLYKCFVFAGLRGSVLTSSSVWSMKLSVACWPLRRMLTLCSVASSSKTQQRIQILLKV